ncbi:hypothetical protein GCM10010917_12550 [Paenibacillus physcomitrellae]|uniref:RNA polymerase sigma-70 region 2 domain-containing protein n=1 Tax=Paenibacillus physcomitrellae TaxID=1619311 RepID=A0ABQ1FTI2_9BACL|nr:hypothetical protein GCM10010917_12550 [Paenibacillus physcomitrellae]
MDLSKEVKKAQKDHVQAFEKLIQSHKTVMYQVAKTILSQDADCGDAIQESILKAFDYPLCKHCLYNSQSKCSMEGNANFCFPRRSRLADDFG